MAQVRTVSGKRGKTYRVQMMRNGQRIDKSFPRKKDAEAFLSRLTVCDDLADAMTSVSLTTIPLSDAIRDYLDQYTGRDTSGIQRLVWWSDRLGDKPVACGQDPAPTHQRRLSCASQRREVPRHHQPL